MEITLNTNLASQIIEVLDSLAEKFGIVIDWSKENVLPKLQELAGKLLDYEIATSLVWCGIALVILIVFAISAIIVRAKSDDIVLQDALNIFAVIAAAVFIIVCAVQIFDIVTCKVFPEKYIFEYLKHLTASSH